jgi:hypothetical protein
MKGSFGYDLRYVIVSHEPGKWNFSENTKLGECLIVAKKLGEGQEHSNCTFINLCYRDTID